MGLVRSRVVGLHGAAAAKREPFPALASPAMLWVSGDATRQEEGSGAAPVVLLCWTGPCRAPALVCRHLRLATSLSRVSKWACPALSGMPPSPPLTPGRVHAQVRDKGQGTAPGGRPYHGPCLTAQETNTASSPCTWTPAYPHGFHFSFASSTSHTSFFPAACPTDPGPQDQSQMQQSSTDCLTGSHNHIREIQTINPSGSAFLIKP